MFFFLFFFNSHKSKLQNVTVGGFCCVSSDDSGEWHRAQIIDTHEGDQHVSVLMIDIGEIKRVHLSKVRILKVI